MQAPPSSFCTMATASCASELIAHLYSLSFYHPNIPVICLVDTITHDPINNLTIAPRLDIKLYTVLDTYSNRTRKEMEIAGVWSEFQMQKATAIEIALGLYDDTLFLDSDTYIFNKIFVNKQKQLGISPHLIKKADEAKFGKYNGGMLWTNQKTVPNDWREFTKTSRFYDQASIEDLAKKYEYFEFDDSYNFSWWRLFQSDVPPEKILKRIHISSTDILYNKRPVKFVHTHFSKANQFNDIVINLLTKLKRYRDLLIIQRIVDEQWVINIPKQPLQEPWAHKNDSFRELCILMQKHNKDLLVSHISDIHHCYLNRTVLLYDRPTLQWFDKTAASSICVYFGNNNVNEQKIPVAVPRPWTFWARRPLILETMIATASLGNLNYDSRGHSVFIGNIENGVQEKYRTGADWGAYISDFNCTKGSTYLFNPKEYLQKIASAKYGLCLRGFGSKCHREIELMAVGTVPLIEKSVDIGSYLHPPIENIHFLRVSCPEDIRRVAILDETQWSIMSRACKDWYMQNAHSSSVLKNLLSDILYSS